MVRFLSLLIVLGLVFLATTWMVAQSSDGSGRLLKRPLDLPSGGLGTDDEEEDESESITFYGSEYEGDGFFWLLDKSGSMLWGGRIQILKQEMTEAINALTSRAQFSMVAYSSNTVAWNQFPVPANSGNKASALAWVQGLSASGPTCMLPAGLKVIEISNLCSKRRKQVIVLGDGVPFCNGQNTGQQCLTEITGANWQRTPIHTIYVSTDNGGVEFMQALATLNNGTFTLAQ